MGRLSLISLLRRIKEWIFDGVFGQGSTPLAKGFIGGDEQRPAFVTGAAQLEQHAGCKSNYSYLCLPAPYSYLKVFISHATKSKSEAEYYANLLREHTFEVFLYESDMLPGQDGVPRPVPKQLEALIEKCDYFLLLICDSSISPNSYCSRELELALHLQTKHSTKDGIAEPTQRPVIIPIYSKRMCWREGENARPEQFPVRAFWTGELKSPYDFHSGHDPHQPHPPRTDKELVEFMKPRLYRARRDVTSTEQLDRSRVFELYECLFPAEDRDDSEDVARWVFDIEDGKQRLLILPFIEPHVQVYYQMDALFYFVTLYGDNPIALCYLDYHQNLKLIAGNYFAVASGWRSGGVAKKFRSAIEADINESYPDAKGILFEIETVDFDMLNRFLEITEDAVNKSNIKIVIDESLAVYKQIRRLKRLHFYQTQLRAQVYIDCNTKKPLAFRAPCLDIELPQPQWSDNEVEHWIMWSSQTAHDAPTWEEAITFYYIENNTKMIVLDHPGRSGEEYWKYANKLMAKNVENSRHLSVEPNMISIKHLRKRLRKIVANHDEIPI